MRVHGRAKIDPANPRALGVCERCGFLYNHENLKWQMDWRGPKIQNLRILICSDCYDKPQPNGQQTILLPADPLPVQNARPEQYVLDDNPLSGLAASPNPNPARYQYGAQFGTLTQGGGIQAAFNGNAYKPAFMSASITTPNSSYGNYVGVNWNGYQPASSPAQTTSTEPVTHALKSYTLSAPNNSTFGSTGWAIQGSSVGIDIALLWTTLASGNTAGTVGEVISGDTAVGGRYQYMRAAFYGGTTPITVAQVVFSVSDGYLPL